MTIDQRIPTKPPGGKPIEVESRSVPGLIRFVSPDLKSCTCEDHQINENLCAHIRIARVRVAKRTLAALRDRLRNELADDETRMELEDRIARLSGRAE